MRIRHHSIGEYIGAAPFRRFRPGEGKIVLFVHSFWCFDIETAVFILQDVAFAAVLIAGAITVTFGTMLLIKLLSFLCDICERNSVYHFHTYGRIVADRYLAYYLEHKVSIKFIKLLVTCKL